MYIGEVDIVNVFQWRQKAYIATGNFSMIGFSTDWKGKRTKKWFFPNGNVHAEFCARKKRAERFLMKFLPRKKYWSAERFLMEFFAYRKKYWGCHRRGITDEGGFFQFGTVHLDFFGQEAKKTCAKRKARIFPQVEGKLLENSANKGSVVPRRRSSMMEWLWISWKMITDNICIKFINKLNVILNQYLCTNL